MSKLMYEDLTYTIIGICMEVHKNLGLGFQEVIYKDALEIEFKNRNIPYEREKEFQAYYKEQALNGRTFFVDFIVYDLIVLEVKAKSAIVDEHIAQTLNYCACSNHKIGLCVNFGALSLQHKRIIK